MSDGRSIPPNWYGIPLKGMRIDNKDGKWRRAYDPYHEKWAEPKPIGTKDIKEKEEATHGFKFPDMQGALGRLGFGLGRKELASKK